MALRVSKKILLVSLAAASLSSCGVVQTQKANTELNEVKAYCKSLVSGPEFDIIRNKIQLERGKKPTFEMLADTSKPTSEEKVAIKKLGNVKTECDSKIADVFVKFRNPELTVIFNSYSGILSGLLADLYNQQITYGELNKQSEKIINQAEAAFANLTKREAAERAESAQRAYQNYLSEQQIRNQNMMIYNMNKPITCNKSGNYTYCNQKFGKILVNY